MNEDFEHLNLISFPLSNKTMNPILIFSKTIWTYLHGILKRNQPNIPTCLIRLQPMINNNNDKLFKLNEYFNTLISLDKNSTLENMSLSSNKT
jgi:hypothetical protein